jgi:hypothetical protein
MAIADWNGRTPDRARVSELGSWAAELGLATELGVPS